MSVFTAEMTPFGRRFDLQDKEVNVQGVKTAAVESTIKTYLSESKYTALSTIHTGSL